MNDYPYKDISMISDDVLFMKDFKDEKINNKYNALMSPLRAKYLKPRGISFKQLIKEVEGITVLNLKKGEEISLP